MKISGVFFQDEAYQELRSRLENSTYSKVAILVDENTHENCLAHFMAELAIELPDLEILEIEAGEASKSIEVLAQLWDSFGALGLDRKSLLINLGGGVVSDLGGFAAATYMRGIEFVNFPTSLLAMADAAVGSKTGINFGAYKNRIGSFSDPLMVGIDARFLESLAQQELLSGYAEMLKHAMLSTSISLEDLFEALIENKLPAIGQIQETIGFKAEVVKYDKKESSLRKVLNFGHTIGHALEAFYASQNVEISHGHAVALGMQVELLLSAQILDFDSQKVASLIKQLNNSYPWLELPIDRQYFETLVLGDKKNSGQKVQMVLLKDIGEPEIDVEVSLEQAWSALQSLSNA